MKYICLRCEKPFEPKYRGPSDLKRHPPKYCSHECGKYARLSRVTLTCEQCGKTFERKKYMQNWSQERGPFCGFSCYGQWQKENTSGPNNPNYSQSSVARDAWNYKTARATVLKRDNYQCVQCGSSRRLHVHHKNDPDNHALDNVETLCASCHKKRHPVPHGQDGKFVSIQ